MVPLNYTHVHIFFQKLTSVEWDCDLGNCDLLAIKLASKTLTGGSSCTISGPN